jgi:hypothetical protein
MSKEKDPIREVLYIHADEVKKMKEGAPGEKPPE